MDFRGNDGSTYLYRFSSDVSSSDTITSSFASLIPLVMKKGTAFVCTDWGVRGGTPMASADEAGKLFYATGSHDFPRPV